MATFQDTLLTLARSDRGLAAGEPVDLATVAEDVLDATDQGRPAAARVTAARRDPVLLERLAASLVDNALRYNTPGGGLWLTTDTVEPGQRACCGLVPQCPVSSGYVRLVSGWLPVAARPL